tara:strand:+ start:14292 stop:15527 length:1236 start_codon:yes stop_codon:yes gene_type:complete
MPTFYKIDDKICKVDDSFLATEVKSLTFQVGGNVFPEQYNTGELGGYLWLEFSKPVTASINYGDGTVDIVDSLSAGGGSHRIVFDSLNTYHYFSSSEVRNITIELSELSALTSIITRDVRLYGNIPLEIIYASNFKGLSLVRTYSIDSFPLEVFEAGSMTTILLVNAVISPLPKIPDSFFSNPFEKVEVSSAFNLADVVSSNFFKINQLKETLKFLDVESCNIIELPSEIAECTKLEQLRIGRNPLNKFPSEIEELENLILLRIGNFGSIPNPSFIDFTKLTKLRTIYFFFDNFNLSEIPIKWKGLKSLTSLLSFNNFITTDNRLNEFILYIYQLVIENAFVDPTSSEALTDDYPNQFRNISWGHSSLTVDSTVEAPPNYQQGISNGDVTTNGHRVYVLANNYNHSITYSN